MAGVPRISVIVPTQRRPEPLARALRSVFRQEGVAPGEVEVVVVDNDLEPTACVTVAALQVETPIPLTCVHEPRPGVASARNTGVRAAQGALLAFLDDDQEAPPRWLAELLAARERLGAQVVFSPALAALPPEVRRHRRYFERFFTYGGPAREQRVHKGYGVGRCLVERAALPDRDAPFAVAYDLTGGEDDELFVRMLENGVVMGWTPDAWVWEHPSPDRVTLRYAMRRTFTYGQGGTNTPLLHDPPQRVKAAVSRAVGVVQALVLGAASLALWLVRQRDRAFVYDKAVRGLGKVLHSPRFHLQFYGLAPGERAGTVARTVETASGHEG